MLQCSLVLYNNLFVITYNLVKLFHYVIPDVLQNNLFAKENFLGSFIILLDSFISHIMYKPFQVELLRVNLFTLFTCLCIVVLKRRNALFPSLKGALYYSIFLTQRVLQLLWKSTLILKKVFLKIILQQGYYHKIILRKT